MPTLREIFSNTADAIRTKTGKSESIYPVDMASEIEGIESGGGYKLEKMPSGAISSFNDGTDLPLNKLKVNIEPVQDLHGYDAPWVGGAGKNKLNNIASSRTENNITFTVNSDGSVKVYSTGATATTVLVLTDTNNPLIIQANKSYILNGCPNGGSNSTYELMLITSPTSGSAVAHDYGAGGTIESDESDRILGVQIVVRSGQAINETFYPMIRLASVTDAAFAPYSNICPISGWDEVNIVVSPTTDAEDGTTYTIQFRDGDNPLTVYGGTLDVVSGVLTVDKGYIASYNGETLPSTWISDRDVYAEGTSPTTGAQVVYELATPITYQLNPTAVKSLLGTNNIWADTGDIINGEYFKGAESGGGQLTQIEAFESGSVSLIATNGVTISSYTINEDMSADITFSESSAGYEGCILGSFENLEIGKSYLLKFEYEFNDAQIMAGYCLGAGIVENPVNDYENANQFNNFVRDSNRHSILLFFDYNFLNTNLVLNLSALDDAQVNKFKLENIRIYEIDSNI